MTEQHKTQHVCEVEDILQVNRIHPCGLNPALQRSLRGLLENISHQGTQNAGQNYSSETFKTGLV